MYVINIGIDNTFAQAPIAVHAREYVWAVRWTVNQSGLTSATTT